ncbi:cation transporting ATPase C-terminal domain-containing protein [Phenylobacterium sp.]|uniref:cation transporting ATPase C-terminal domain-containing protein n=1 Tax=Phenylobacterium sp. TaxID=1871053 RepID=UPI003982F1DF
MILLGKKPACFGRSVSLPPDPLPSLALLGQALLGLALLHGGGVLVGVFSFHLWSQSHSPEAEARGATFLALVVGNLVLALADASSTGGRLFAPHRKIYWIISAVAGVVLIAVLAVPLLADLFKVTPPDLPLLCLALAVAGLSGGWFRVARSLHGLSRRGWAKATRLAPS